MIFGVDKKLIGRIVATHYYVFEENLPVKKEEMKQFVRKMSKAEIKEIKALTEKHIFCSIKLEGRSDSLYYISPFTDIELGDIVEVTHNWYGTLQGIVVKIEHVLEKDAPYPLKKTKKINKIVLKLNKLKQNVDTLINNSDKENFLKLNIAPTLIEQYSKIAYFSSAVFRGIVIDVCNILKEIYPLEINPLKHMDDLGNGIAQFECPNALVPKILEKYPNLKAIFFAEYWNEKNVYLAYSESGYSTITSLRLIGKCDFYIRDRWPLMHDPSEENFECEKIKYVFEEKELWEKLDFVIEDGSKKISSITTIPSKPFHKVSSYDPCIIIEIHWD